MALDETKFSHITVTSDDEDDVVIQAGAYGSGSMDEDVVDGFTAESAAEAVCVDAGDEMSEPLSLVNSTPEPGSVLGSDTDDEEGGTKIEDLEVGPMSMTQKAVIVLAVLFIIGFAVYYVFFF